MTNSEFNKVIKNKVLEENSNLDQSRSDSEIFCDIASTYFLGRENAERMPEKINLNLDEFDIVSFMNYSSPEGDNYEFYMPDYDMYTNNRTIKKGIEEDIFEGFLSFINKIGNKEFINSIPLDTPERDVCESLITGHKISKTIRIYIMSNGVFEDETISEKEYSLNKINLTIIPIGINILKLKYEKFMQGNQGFTINIDEFNDTIKSSIITKNASIKVFSLAMNGILLGKIYDKYGKILLEDNVRLFLGSGVSVNKGIQDTIKNNPEMFISYNNGISAIASDVVIDSNNNVKSITNLQIVNGGQTTASIHHAFNQSYRANLDDIYVQFKLTVIEDSTKIKSKELYKDLTSKIAKYANTQNAVKYIDFIAAHPFFEKIEEFSRSVFSVECGKKYYFERMRGQYKLDTSIKGSKYMKEVYGFKFDIQVIARIYLLVDMLPQKVSAGGQTASKTFANKLENGKFKKLEMEETNYKNMISYIILYHHIDEIIKSSNPDIEEIFEGSKSPFGPNHSLILYYTAAFIFKNKYYSLNLESIWEFGEVKWKIEENSFIVKTAEKVYYFFKKNSNNNFREFAKKELALSQFSAVFKP